MHYTELLRSFRSRQDGGVVTIFALSLFGLGLSAGLALDYARAYSAESALRSDLDAAILGAASHLADPSAIQKAAMAVFDANWKAKHSVSSISLVVAKTANNKLAGTATATVPTTLMKLGGFDTMSLKAMTEVEVAGQNVELALVLDTTTSMAGAKLQGLKDAAKLLVETAYEAPYADKHVKVGIVPFGQYVNVGIGNRYRPWMSVPADSSTQKQWCRDESPVTSTTNCRMETVNTTQDGMPHSYSHEVCDHTYGAPVYTCSDYIDTDVWNGCAGSRDYPLDTLDEQFGTPVPGVMDAACGAEVTSLTNDTGKLNSEINSLIATGDTYIPAGLMWGWSLLSKEAPYNQGSGYGEKVDGKPVQKIMVLMTDGFNTLSPIYPEHTGGDTTQSNTLTQELCTNIKAKDIKVYTVAFEVANNAIKGVLEGCATHPSMFFDATDAGELAAAFRDIAKDFSPLRLAK